VEAGWGLQLTDTDVVDFPLLTQGTHVPGSLVVQTDEIDPTEENQERYERWTTDGG
jgi:hypothetical protein